MYNIDADGDGFAAWVDCDDNDASVGSSANDADCDGVTVSAGDCDDNDASIYPFAGDTYGDGIDSDCDGLDCEAASDGSTYFAVCEPNYWSDISSYCQSAGYDFGSIRSSVENTFVDSLLRNSALFGAIPAADGDVIWLNYTNQSGVWTWGDGYNGSYANWAPGKTDETNVCAYMSLTGSGGSWPQGSWDDTSCSGGARASLCTVR